MAIHLHPFRLHKGRLCLSQGLLVEMLRNTKIFWDAYKDLLEVNGKIKSDNAELQRTMKKMKLTPKKGKPSEKKTKKVLANLNKEFDLALKRNEDMFESLETIMLDDETLLYRSMVGLKKIYYSVMKIKHLPDHMLHGMLHHMHSILHQMREVQHHNWVMAKAPARGKTKVATLAIVTSRGERRRIRRQTIELNHWQNRIEPLKEWIRCLKEVKTQEDAYILHQRVDELLLNYTEELHNLKHILHEAHVLSRRTEKVFAKIKSEAEEAGSKALKRKMESYERKFKRIHRKLVNQARRELLDMDKILKRLKEPPTKAAEKTTKK